jgi:hypothetical protein
MTAGVKVFPGRMVGPVASRPAILHPGDYQGQYYQSEDEDRLYFSDGDEWLEVTTPEGAQITLDQMPATLAGAGLSGSNGSPLAVGVDGSTLEIASNALRIKSGGITKALLPGGFLKIIRMDAQDETSDATIDVTGLAVGDELVAFFVVDLPSTIWEQRALTDFTISANILTVVANAANNNGEIYVIFYLDRT